MQEQRSQDHLACAWALTCLNVVIGSCSPVRSVHTDACAVSIVSHKPVTFLNPYYSTSRSFYFSLCYQCLETIRNRASMSYLAIL